MESNFTKLKTCVGITFLMVSVSQCIYSQNDTLKTLDYNRMSEEQKLLIINYVPLGSTYEEVKSKFPSLSSLKKEVANLYEATATVDILNRAAKIEFNFNRRKELYSYYYSISGLDYDKADSLYVDLQGFYSQQYGIADKDSTKESNYQNKSNYWETPDFTVSVGNNIYPQHCILSWGFQVPYGRKR